MDARGEIFWSANGNPRRKVYLDESSGVGVQDIWLDFRDAHNQNIRITGYPTEKNPELLSRIVNSSSNPGDLVVDCYCGSGTTLAVASQLGRRWIGVDNSLEAIRTTLRRFAVGTMPMGDFVSQRKEPPRPPKPSKAKQRSLFHAIEDDSASPRTEHEHSPVVDFALFAETTVADTLAEVVRDWEAGPDGSRQEAASMRVAATVPPARASTAIREHG